MNVREQRDREADAVTPVDVLDTFATYQSQTAPMVAEKLDVRVEGAVVLLDELVARGELTKARAHTAIPVWILPHPRTEGTRTRR